MDREMSMLEGHMWRKRIGVHPYCNSTNYSMEGAVQTGQENGDPPTYSRTDPHSPHPARASSPTESLSSTDTTVNQLAQWTNPFPHCSGAAPLSTREWYRHDSMPAQHSRERTDQQGTPGMGTGHVTLPGGLEVVVEPGTSNNPITIPDSKPTTPTMVWCFQYQSTEHVHPQCPEYICPFCQTTAPGHPQCTCLMHPCPICRELGHVGTSCLTTTAACSPSLPPQMSDLGRFWVSASMQWEG